LIKQERSDRWANIPGQLNYKLSKKLHITLPQVGPKNATENDFTTALKAGGLAIDVKTSRAFNGTTYLPTYSIVNYRENYTLGLSIDGKQEVENVPNFAALSVWSQLVGDGRADFVSAFHALAEVQDLLNQTDIYDKYLWYNLFHFGYKDADTLGRIAFAGISADTQTKLVSDATYGFGKILPFQNWFKAYRGGSSSPVYQAILAHFSAIDKAFTDAHMQQIVGPRSMMQMLDHTFATNLGAALGYAGNKPDPTLLVKDQWASGRMTESTDIPVFDASDDSLMLKSVYDLYNVDPAQQQALPAGLHVVTGYEPELAHYATSVLGLSKTDASFSAPNARALFTADIVKGEKSLLNPANLQFFYEKYK